MMELVSSRTTMKKINGDSLTPILIFRRLQGSHKFLLESSAQHEGAGRYSFIGSNPRKTYVGTNDGITEYAYESGQTYTHQGELFVLLKRLMPRISNTTEFPFSGGAVGYVGYNAAQKFTADDETLDLPNVHFHIYETIIVFDHVTDEITLIHTNIEAEKQQPDLDALAHHILFGETSEDTVYEYEAMEETQLEHFTEVVEKVKAAIENEHTRVVLSKRFTASLKGDPLALYRKLRKENPAPYMYYVTFDDHVVMGTSPDSLIRVKGDHVISTPTAGHLKRGETKLEDLENERILYENVGVRNAHTTVVAAVQEELKSVCFHDSIKVLDAMHIERSKKALHMTSRVEGKLLPMLHALDALSASLPPVSLTGTPKDRAMALLKEIDHTAGIFGGALGFIGFDGHLDFALTGNSIVVKEDIAHMQIAVSFTKLSNIEEVVERVNDEIQGYQQSLQE
ncbi:MAG: anthranilate synthase component I family protein [Lysinibacillus sp.]